MAQVGDSAHTPHGLGQITEVLKERGRSSFRVAGRGFDVWVDETRLHVAGLESTIDLGGGSVNERNHTTLPYDPTPQYHADLFRHEQTIQPGEHEIDADKRLHPSDSLSGNSRTDVRGPQPSSSLFAAPGTENQFADERTSALHDAAPGFQDAPEASTAIRAACDGGRGGMRSKMTNGARQVTPVYGGPSGPEHSLENTEAFKNYRPGLNPYEWQLSPGGAVGPLCLFRPGGHRPRLPGGPVPPRPGGLHPHLRAPVDRRRRQPGEVRRLHPAHRRGPEHARGGLD